MPIDYDFVTNNLLRSIKLNEQIQPYSRHYCAIIINRKIVCKTINIHGFHAEHYALKKFEKMFSRYKKPKITLFVIRIDRNGFLLNSKPCKHCVQKIKMYNVKYGYVFDKIVYSMDYNIYVTEKLSELKNSHITLFNRKV